METPSEIHLSLLGRNLLAIFLSFCLWQCWGLMLLQKKGTMENSSKELSPIWFISNKSIIWFQSKESKELTSVWFISKKSIIWFRSAESRESHLSWTTVLNYNFCDWEFCAQGSLDIHTYKVHGIQTEKGTLHKHYHAVHEGRKTYKKSHWILKIPYARHYKPRLVYFLPHFSLRFIIKSGYNYRLFMY